MELLARVVVVLAVVGGAAVFGLWWRRRDGRVRGGDGRFDRAQLTQLGLDAHAARVLGVLLTSPACAPCRTVRRILDEVGRDRDDLRWVAVDAGDHLGIARAHHVLRVPTLFLLAPDGRILARTSGVPARRDLEHVLDREAGVATSRA